MNKQRIITNLLIMGSGQIVTWLLSTVALVLASRYFGPDRAGKLALAGYVVAVLGLMVTLGMDTLLTRTVARTRERAGTLTSAALIVRSALAIPMLCILVAYTMVANLDIETREVTFIMAGVMIIGALSGVLIAVFQGYEQMSLGAITGILVNLLDVIAVALVFWLHGSLVLLVALYLPIQLLLLLLNVRWARRYAHLAFRVSVADLREVIAGSLAFWANGIFLTIYIAIDSIILASLADTRAVGIYAAATRLFSVALFLPAIVGQATLPLLSRRGVEAGADFLRAGRETFSLLVACAVPLAIGLATFSAPLIALLFGPAYLQSGPALVVLSLCIVPTFVNIQAAQTLAACDRQWRWTLVMGVSCVINPLINFWLIPFATQHWHNAALGAASALLATELLMAAYAVITLHRMIVTAAFARVLVASLAAGAIQLVLIRLAAPLWSPVAEALGLAAYAIAALALGGLPRAELALLWRVLGVKLWQLRSQRAGEVTL